MAKLAAFRERASLARKQVSRFRKANDQRRSGASERTPDRNHKPILDRSRGFDARDGCMR